MDRLDHLRKQGAKKAAIITATGVGKTYLAAFDFHQITSNSNSFWGLRPLPREWTEKTF
jgi:superfamily II DNA or RNA helicase